MIAPGGLEDDPVGPAVPEPSGYGPEAVPVIGKSPVLAIQVDVEIILADIDACD